MFTSKTVYCLTNIIVSIVFFFQKYIIFFENNIQMRAKIIIDVMSILENDDIISYINVNSESIVYIKMHFFILLKLNYKFTLTK